MKRWSPTSAANFLRKHGARKPLIISVNYVLCILKCVAQVDKWSLRNQLLMLVRSAITNAMVALAFSAESVVFCCFVFFLTHD